MASKSSQAERVLIRAVKCRLSAPCVVGDRIKSAGAVMTMIGNDKFQKIGRYLNSLARFELNRTAALAEWCQHNAT